MLGRTALGLGVTAHRLSKNVTFYINELASTASGCQTQASVEHKPLMLMLPWLGSRPQAVAKYCEIYFQTGFDVLVVESEVRTIEISNPDINTIAKLILNIVNVLYFYVEQIQLYCCDLGLN